MTSDVILGICVECGKFVYEDDAYKDLGGDCFIHTECLPLDERGFPS